MSFETSIFFTAFSVVFIAELGDKTQLVAFSLTSTSKSPFLIFVATSLALSLSGLLAALLGTLAKQVIPDFTAYIAAGLFFIFGACILMSREAPNIKEWFLATVSFETALLHVLPRIFRKEDRYDSRIMNIIRQESSHASIFRTLLKEKRLFKDDINEDREIETLQKELTLPHGMHSKPFDEVLDIIIQKETAVCEVYRLMADHLAKDHHRQDALQDLLLALVAEETEHIAVFTQIREELPHETV